MIRREGDRDFPVSLGTTPLTSSPKRYAARPLTGWDFSPDPRGLTNEVYYVFQKLTRVLGTNNVGICSRLCHAASVSGLKATLGIGAPTCSLFGLHRHAAIGYFRLRSCQQPAGHHQIHALRQETRHAHRRRESNA